MKKLIFSRTSDHDLKKATEYYNDKQTGLGDRLFNQVQNKIFKIVDNPLAYSIRYKNIRCVKIDRFPFMIHFIDEPDAIVIIGIIHTSRNPKHWKQRNKK